MIYLLIGIGIYTAIVTFFLLFFVGAYHDEENELELFRYYIYCEAVRLEKIYSEIAYMKTQYGVDDYVRG